MSDRSNKRGFTLIELLVVITIIAILASILVPMVKKAIEKGKITATRSAVLGIETAWKSYQAEYGKWPMQGGHLFNMPAGESGMPRRMPADGIKVTDEVMALLTGEPEDEYRRYRKEIHNPKGILFMEINREFLIKEDDDHRYGDFTDPWGGIYRFALDLNYDNRVSIEQWLQGQNVHPIAKSVIAWSMGPDGSSANSDARVDDIISW